MFVTAVRTVTVIVAYQAVRQTHATAGTLEFVALPRSIEIDVNLKLAIAVAILFIRIIAAVVGPVALPDFRDALANFAKELLLKTNVAVMLVVIFRTMLDTVAPMKETHTERERER